MIIAQASDAHVPRQDPTAPSPAPGSPRRPRPRDARRVPRGCGALPWRPRLRGGVSPRRGRDRGARARPRARAADRRPVLGDGRGDADGRRGDLDRAPERDRGGDARPGAAAVRRRARDAAGAAGRRGPLLPAHAHLHRRLRRWGGGHQRVGRGHLQVRQHAPLGRVADGGARLWRRAGARARRSGGAPRRLVRDRGLVGDAPGPGARLSHARRAEAVGRLLRGARHGPDRSLHRRRGHARPRGRGRVPGDPARGGRGARARAGHLRVARDRARPARCARRPSAPGARAIRAASTSPESRTWTGAASRCCTRTARTGSTT